jgi:alpha-mannosidase
VKLSTTGPFYEMLEQKADKWDVLQKELNFEFTGCYTTQTSIKRHNRLAEQLLYQAEAAASLAWLQSGKQYPGEAMREGWINTLFSQFHDILPGSCVRASREYNSGQYQETAARGGMALTNSLRAVAAGVNTKCFTSDKAGGRAGNNVGAGAGHESGMGAVSTYDGGGTDVRPFVVYNLNGWERSEVVVATLWNVGWNEIVVEDDGGNRFAGQILEKGGYWGHDFIKVAFPAWKIPAMGYRTFALSAGHAAPAPCAFTHTPHGAENEHYRLEMDWQTGGIAKLVDKRTGVDFAVPGEPMGLLEYAVERHHGMSSWVIGDIQKVEGLTELVSLEEKRGPYHVWFVGKLKLNDSTITVETNARAGDPCVEIVISVNWLERGHAAVGVPSLRFRVPVAVEADSAAFEAPYGSTRRTLMNGEEVPSQRWVDLSGVRGGVTVLNDSKYGHAIDGNTVRTTLIRSAYDPDPLPEIGDHLVRMGIIAHGAGWGIADATRAGVDFNQPLAVIGTGVHDGSLPSSASFVTISEPNVVLAAVKKSEDSETLVFRLYETEGRDSSIRMSFGSIVRPTQVANIDLLEKPTSGDAALDGSTVTASIPAHGIVSLQVTFQR